MGVDVCYYAGKWVSRGYAAFIAGGSVAARFNFADHRALIYFRYEGVYRKGSTTRLETELKREVHPHTGALCYALSFTVEGQEISFRVEHVSPEVASGTYKSVSPPDNGTFKLEKITESQFNAFQHTNSAACTLM